MRIHLFPGFLGEDNFARLEGDYDINVLESHLQGLRNGHVLGVKRNLLPKHCLWQLIINRIIDSKWWIDRDSLIASTNEIKHFLKRGVIVNSRDCEAAKKENDVTCMGRLLLKRLVTKRSGGSEQPHKTHLSENAE
jgi:hypothetical protein